MLIVISLLIYSVIPHLLIITGMLLAIFSVCLMGVEEIRMDKKITEEKFLEKNFRIMPRTALRYAIERFNPARKKYFMSKPENKS